MFVYFYQNRLFLSICGKIIAFILMLIFAMSELNLSFIADVFQVALPCPDFVINKITTDSRTVQQNDVFFALSGEKFDGHDFVDEVLSHGAVCVVSRADCAENQAA